MIDFEAAVEVARRNAVKLIKEARNLTLEGVVLSEDARVYEVSFSYDLDRRDLATPELAGRENSNLAALAAIMGRRREYKVFLVDRTTAQFQGFRNALKD